MEGIKVELLIGTRNSKLALVQAERVSKALSKKDVSVRGDVDKTSPFLKFGGPSDAATNIWTEEMEAKLSSGELDLLVHCLKNMPTNLPEACVIGAIIHREDLTDALVVKDGLPYTDLAGLPAGSVVGTSSTRRKALLKYKYPHLVIRECRGNLETRLRKLDVPEGPFSAIIVATAGLNRIDLSHRITKSLSASESPYAVGQGALGIEIRANEPSTLSVIRKIEELPTRWISLAERSLLHNIIHRHGSSQVSSVAVSDVAGDGDAESLGAMLAKQLEENGGRALLDEIRTLQQNELRMSR
ncbi:porphobilinogen deaminase [Penicillium argentinense]|uniref:hydroxymethylbilane synthase n=1 Tax=Penicillium argentinense TaxID=1131581 RepID=A0A9W9FGV8_9EURO|nr:porphobilinogen deaminase [Penicillium argentinense]KAJ5099957.1 porphobilinogen deaminase [Penicillium argentinense]